MGQLTPPANEPPEDDTEEQGTRRMHPAIKQLSALMRILDQLPSKEAKVLTLDWMKSIVEGEE